MGDDYVVYALLAVLVMWLCYQAGKLRIVSREAKREIERDERR